MTEQIVTSNKYRITRSKLNYYKNSKRDEIMDTTYVMKYSDNGLMDVANAT